MSNQLRMAMIEAILALHRRGWSQRRIADALGVDRETVARHVGEAKPARVPTGSDEAQLEAKPARVSTGSDEVITSSHEVPIEAEPRQSSLCEPWRGVIEAKLGQGLSAQRIYQDLVAEHGFSGKYSSVRRFVRRLLPEEKLPFRRLECGPGEEAQVDFGQGAWIEEQGRRYRPHVFRIVLSYSRKAYSEVVRRQTTEAFLGCLENAWWHFGGAPERVVLDNLRAAVRRADWYDPELNPKVRSFGQHYGSVFLPTKPYMPRHKGKVERGVDYVQENALKGRVFASLEEQNRYLLEWEQTVADTRVHGTTRRQVGGLFREVERAALQRLPLERFPSFREGRRKVHRDGHVEVDRAYYSVPPEHLGRWLWVRWDSRLVRIFTERLELVATHVKHEPGRFSTQQQHVPERKISGIERGPEWLLAKVRHLGPRVARWSEAVLAERGVEGSRVLQGLLHLAGQHPVAALEQACDIALSHGVYHLRTLRALLVRQAAAAQEQAGFLAKHALLRELSVYDQFVRSMGQGGL